MPTFFHHLGLIPVVHTTYSKRTSNWSGVSEDAKFDCVGSLSINGTCTSTTGKTREISKDRQVQKLGINPHDGRTFKETLRYQVKTDGTVEGIGEWAE